MISYIKRRIRHHFIANNSIPDLSNSLLRLKHQGYNPRVVFDIGAYEGEFSLLINQVWPESEIYCFEPLNSKYSVLNRISEKIRNIHFYDVLLGDIDKENITFYQAETASSVLEERHHQGFQEIRLKMHRLDTFISQEKLPVPSFLKLDTQGFEYQILKGMENDLGKVDIIVAELNLIDIHQNVMLAGEIIAFLDTFDFVPYDITELRHRPLDKTLYQVDIMFVKKSSSLRSDKRWSV